MLSLFPIMTLMLDAASVIEIRLRMMALGKSTPNELVLMVTEKLNALEEAKVIMMRGGALRLSSITTRRSSRRTLYDCLRAPIERCLLAGPRRCAGTIGASDG